MSSLLRRLAWWLRPSRKESEIREELQFHIAEETEERRAGGMREDEARWAAQRDLGNEARVREEVRAVWTWRPLDELSQDLRYAFRTLFKQRAVTIFAIASLALGIGANTAIFSFMDAILMRALPIADPESLVVLSWHSKPWSTSTPSGRGGVEREAFVLHSIDGSTYRYSGGIESQIFPYETFALLQEASQPVFTSLFGYKSAGRLNVTSNGEAELTQGEYVSENFFTGLAVAPEAGRLITAGDDQPGTASAAVVSHGYSERRFGGAANAVGQQISINSRPFTIVGVTPAEFFGVDPAAAPSVYLPLHTDVLFDARENEKYQDRNYYWLQMMGRRRPDVTTAQAEARLSQVFAGWVTTTATDNERKNLPQLRLDAGAGGLDSLRRKYSQPLYVLFGMVALILAIACANTANLLLARASARRREIAVRLSIGAGRFRLIRQLLTESVVLSSIAGALGVVVAIGGVRVLTVLLANGDAAFTLHAELNWRVLAITIGLSVLCGITFGLVPALQSTRPELVPALKDSGAGEKRVWKQWNLRSALVVGQISVLMLLLIGAGLFVRTLSNLQAIPLGFNPDHVLLFELNAPQAGYPQESAWKFYAGLRDRFAGIPGVRAVTLAHSSLIRAGRGHPIKVRGVEAENTRFLQTGPAFFSTMQIPMLQGREIDARDQEGSLPVAVVSDLFARMMFPNENPIGQHLAVGGSAGPLDLEVIGVAASARYGPLKSINPAVVYVPYSQLPKKQVQQMVYALRTDGDPMRHVNTIRQIVHDADPRVPVTNVVTQADDIDRTINQEIVLARLCTAFAVLALVIACVGLYGTMAYTVVRRTREIGIRMALGAKRGAVIWMVLREVCVLAVIGLAISIPVARALSTTLESLLFDMKPNDPRALGLALVTLLAASLAAAYAPARRASRIDPTTALRHE